VADGNGVDIYADFSDEQADDLLPLGEIERVGASAKLGAEVGQRFAQPEVAGLVGRGRLDGFALGLDGALLRPQRRHPRAEVLERDQFLLIGGHEPINGGRHPSLVAKEVVEAVARRIGVSGCLPASGQFGLDQGRGLEQAHDLAPDERIQVILTCDRRGTHRLRAAAPGIPSPAAIDPAFAMNRVATLAAHEQPL
jgi:hypothetical protein